MRNSRPISRPSSLTLANRYQEGEVMADLLGTVVEAHGGVERWNELETVTAHLAQAAFCRHSKASRGALTTSSSRQACMRSGSHTTRSALPAGEASSPPNASRYRPPTEPWSRHWNSRGPRSLA